MTRPATFKTHAPTYSGRNGEGHTYHHRFSNGLGNNIKIGTSNQSRKAKTKVKNGSLGGIDGQNDRKRPNTLADYSENEKQREVRKNLGGNRASTADTTRWSPKLNLPQLTEPTTALDQSRWKPTAIGKPTATASPSLSAPGRRHDLSAQVHHHPTHDKIEKEIGVLGENRKTAQAASEGDRVNAADHHEQLPCTLWRRSRWGVGGLRWKTRSG